MNGYERCTNAAKQITALTAERDELLHRLTRLQDGLDNLGRPLNDTAETVHHCRLLSDRAWLNARLQKRKAEGHDEPLFTYCLHCGEPTDERLFCETCKEQQEEQREHDEFERRQAWEY